MTRDATDADDGDDAPAPHLGAAVLARIVAATFSPGYDPDDDCYFEVEKTRRNLRLCCRLLRDLVDEEKTRVTVEVSSSSACVQHHPFGGRSAQQSVWRRGPKAPPRTPISLRMAPLPRAHCLLRSTATLRSWMPRCTRTLHKSWGASGT